MPCLALIIDSREAIQMIQFDRHPDGYVCCEAYSHEQEDCLFHGDS